MKNEANLSPRQVIDSFIDKTSNEIPISRQADLLGVSRSTIYYTPAEMDLETLRVMKEIDELYTKRPFYGSRRIAANLDINRKQAQRLMRVMGIQAVYPKPNLSKNAKKHPVYPYLLRGITAQYPNHIWGTDITFIRMAYGFLYLTVFLDWYSRFVLSWRLSTTLEADFCIEAAKAAIEQYNLPDISNSDQGSQYTSEGYLNIWKEQNVSISMDGRGRCMDNIFTERFWRSLKYEEVYLKNYESVQDAYAQIAQYIDFYNHERKHQSLNYQVPAEYYFQQPQEYFQKQKIGLLAESTQPAMVLNLST